MRHEQHDDAQVIPLREAVAALREEIAETIKDGEDKDADIRFEGGPIELEFQVEVRGEKEGTAEVKPWFFALHIGATKSTAQTHTVKLTMTPVQRVEEERPPATLDTLIPRDDAVAYDQALRAIDVPPDFDPELWKTDVPPGLDPEVWKTVRYFTSPQRTAHAKDAMVRLISAAQNQRDADMEQAITDLAPHLGMRREDLT